TGVQIGERPPRGLGVLGNVMASGVHTSRFLPQGFQFFSFLGAHLSLIGLRLREGVLAENPLRLARAFGINHILRDTSPRPLSRHGIGAGHSDWAFHQLFWVGGKMVFTFARSPHVPNVCGVSSHYGCGAFQKFFDPVRWLVNRYIGVFLKEVFGIPRNADSAGIGPSLVWIKNETVEWLPPISI